MAGYCRLHGLLGESRIDVLVVMNLIDVRLLIDVDVLIWFDFYVYVLICVDVLICIEVLVSYWIVLLVVVDLIHLIGDFLLWMHHQV